MLYLLTGKCMHIFDISEILCNDYYIHSNNNKYLVMF